MENKQRDDKDIPKLTFPAISWRWEFFLTLVPFILGFIVFFLPDFSTSNSKTKIIIGSILVSVPLIVPLFYWLTLIVAVILKRIRYYPIIYERLIGEVQRLKILQNDFSRRLLQAYGENELEITKAMFINNKSYIVLAKNKLKAVSEGTEIIVFDKADFMEMGRFEITEIRKREYYAIGTIVNPVWLGFIREKGEITTFPNLKAIALFEGENNESTN